MIGDKRSPALVVVFSVITCGIYFLYWIYKVSEETRFYNDDDSISPGLELLLCILCAPYIIYWFYKYGNVIYNAHTLEEITVPDDNAILYLLLAIFMPVIAAAIMQASLNKLWDKKVNDKGI